MYLVEINDKSKKYIERNFIDTQMGLLWTSIKYYRVNLVEKTYYSILPSTISLMTKKEKKEKNKVYKCFIYNKLLQK